LDNFVRAQGGQAKADASSGVTQYRHANAYTANVSNAAFEDETAVRLAGD